MILVIMYIREEHNELKSWFKEWFGQHFDKKIIQYIANFEKIKFSLNNNQDNDNLNKIEILTIDILLSPSTAFNDENSKVFFNLFRLIKKAEKMATYFANQSFNYFSISISIIHLMIFSPLMIIAMLLIQIFLLILLTTNTNLTNSMVS